MTLLSGVKLGAYEITGPLGAGGMGEVYRARDSKLKREVAIKVLTETFSHDSQRIERLRREAEVLASLNHPHIAAIYDLVDAGASPFLVLELVEGETLEERIAGGPLRCEEAFAIARQIAEALEAAHDKGITHRDLKPANVKITSDGTVKVLDFGLAKVQAAAAGSVDASTMIATVPGLILGTAAYMSPEQANGKEADRASDVWAFGCVLYEMLTGRRAFEGATMSEILANVLKTPPDWLRLSAETPPPIRRLLRRCLQKDPKLRLRDIRDARIEIDEVITGVSENDRASRARPAWRERMAWAAALALVTVAAAVFGVRANRQMTAAPELRLEINTPPTRNAGLAMSPDGTKIVFVGRADGGSRLWLRSLDSSVARPLSGTERGLVPFWAPDGRSIGFVADAKLKVINIDGGSLRTLADAAVPLGGTWNRDGTILFGSSPGGPIQRVSVNGGDFTAATRIAAAQERGHGFPTFLPDGRRFLFFALGGPGAGGVYIGQLDDVNTRRLLESDGPAAYAAPGHLLFVREGKLLAQGFDPDRVELRGDPIPIAEGLSAGAVVSVSDAGAIAYRTGPPDGGGQHQLIWVDRSGRETAKVVYPGHAAIGPSLSSDGGRVAVYRQAHGNMDIWSYEVNRRAWDRITFDLGDDIYPLWSRDGRSVVFGRVRSTVGVVDLYRRLVSDPPGKEELLLATPTAKFPMDLSRDGRFVVYDTFRPKHGSDIWALPLEGERAPFVVLATEFAESQAQFSPDGRWIAYQTDKTGRPEVYIRPFPGPGADVRASIDGGSQPRWSPKGDELFYIGADDRIMSVAIRFPESRSTVDPGVPSALFATNIGSTVSLAYRQQYMVSVDGQSFVLNSRVGDAVASPITVILNWKPK